MGDGATRDDPGAAARGAVVVTGASTGIGRATALRLARLGFDVLAGVRRDADGERLVSEPPGLWRRQLEVNVVGQVAVTQALLPLLRRGRGRIVNVSSVGGRVSTPALGAYSASKFALEALSDSLRMELRPWGIDVVVIEPGSIRTEIWRRGEKQAESLMERLPEAQRALYAPLVAGMRRLSARTQERAIAPERVAERIARALTTRRPRTRYVVGADACVQMALHAALPDRAYDALVRRLLGTSESGAPRMG